MSFLLTTAGVLLVWILLLACVRIAILGLILVLGLLRLALMLLGGRA